MQPSACDAFLNLLRTGDMVFAAESRFLARHGVSQGRFTVMMLLHHCCGPSTPAELAEEAGVTRATMTGLLDTLEKDGWARRTTDPDDRRVTKIQLTPAGEAFISGMLPEYFACVSRMMDPLREDERQQFVALLQKVQQGVPGDMAPSCHKPLSAPAVA